MVHPIWADTAQILLQMWIEFRTGNPGYVLSLYPLADSNMIKQTMVALCKCEYHVSWWSGTQFCSIFAQNVENWLYKYFLTIIGGNYSMHLKPKRLSTKICIKIS